MMMICVKQRTYLKGANGSRLETQIGLEILSNFTHQSLEGQLTDEQLGRLLVTTDLTKSHSTGTITMGLLYTTGGWCRFTGCLGGQLLAWSFTSSGFTSGLLGTCHFNLLRIRMLQGERNRERERVHFLFHFHVARCDAQRRSSAGARLMRLWQLWPKWKRPEQSREQSG